MITIERIDASKQLVTFSEKIGENAIARYVIVGRSPLAIRKQGYFGVFDFGGASPAYYYGIAEGQREKHMRILTEARVPVKFADRQDLRADDLAQTLRIACERLGQPWVEATFGIESFSFKRVFYVSVVMGVMPIDALTTLQLYAHQGGNF